MWVVFYGMLILVGLGEVVYRGVTGRPVPLDPILYILTGIGGLVLEHAPWARRPAPIGWVYTLLGFVLLYFQI
jgi:hypothetical protein